MKFARYNVRNAIFKTKNILKGETVRIAENLTKKREMKKAGETYDFLKKMVTGWEHFIY